jgi:tellurite resistance protein TerC
MKLADLTYRAARRVVVTLVGGTVVLIGLVMVIFPGPATVVIPIGLAILGLEWAWARRLLRAVKEKGGEALDRVGIGARIRQFFGASPAPTRRVPLDPAESAGRSDDHEG